MPPVVREKYIFLSTKEYILENLTHPVPHGDVLRPIPGDGEISETMKDLLLSDEDIRRLHDLIEHFLESYYHRPEGQDVSEWLKDEFARHAKTWFDEDERLQDVRQILEAGEVIADRYRNLREHLDQGKSLESWIATQIEDGARSLGIDTSQHAHSLEEALQKATRDLVEQCGIQVRQPFSEKLPEGSGPAEWNELTRLVIAKDLKQLTLENSCIAAKGMNIIAGRVLNTLMGREQRDFSEDLEDFCKSSLKEAVNAGIGTAVSGALTVFGRGSQSTILRALPGGALTAIAFGTLDKARILYQTADGSLEPYEAIDAAANSTCCIAGSLFGGSLLSTIGASVGTVLGPIGTAVGAAAGSIVGSIAGSSVAQKVYDGGKKFCSAVKECASAAWEGAKSVVSSAWSGIKSLFS